MRSKFAVALAALALAGASTIATVSPAAAQHRGTFGGGAWHGGHGGHGGWHGGYRGGGWGWGPAAGFAAGALLGSALVAPYYYGGPYYYGAPYAYEGPVYDDDAVAYCMRRYRSYDPVSGTYLGYDGLRHPCP